MPYRVAKIISVLDVHLIMKSDFTLNCLEMTVTFVPQQLLSIFSLTRKRLPWSTFILALMLFEEDKCILRILKLYLPHYYL